MTPQPQLDTDNLPEPTRLHLALIEKLDKGLTPGEIAKQLAKGDQRLAKKYRAKIRRMLAKDPILHRAIVEHAQGTLRASLPGAMSAAGRRAQRGRMDAVRFVSESTGFHNPRVQHEHSGEVKIKLDMPRPQFVDTESVADDHVIEEADVVEPDET
jgi:hypothetical protein